MRDLIKRISIGLVTLGLIGYLTLLYLNKTIIVQDYFSDRNFWYYLVLLLVFVYILIFFSIIPTYFKISKVSLFVSGIALIVLGDTVLINDVQRVIFLGDLIKIVGVILTLFAFTNLFVTSKVKKQKDASQIEIIEI